MGTYSEPDEEPRELVVATDWIIQTCSTPGCYVVIRSRVGRQPSIPICRWCDQGVSHVMRHKVEQPKRPGNIGKIELGK